MIEVKNLCKSYGDKLAVDNISFEAHNGEILGFLGPNGAGKSTTMNILTGYLSSTSGEAYINGKEILEEPLLAKKEIGYLPEFPPLYLDMTVREYLNFMYELKNVKIPRNTHLQEICELVKIEDVYDRLIKNLSKGYKQRVGLAQALVGNPNVLILDEPTVGLDPKQIIEIRTLIKKLGKNHTVILSSHILSEVQAVCDRIVIINNGKIIADDTADNLSNTLTADHKLVARIDGPRDEVTKVISSIPGVVSVLADMQREKGVWEYNIEAVEGTDIRRELNRRLSQRNWYIMGLRPSELTLEDIFLRLTMGESVDEFINQKAESLDNHGEAKKS
ncbi:MAG: ABC transporter ATP-binding protein [Oscillospiraceae bacterium]|nr:ABC transporter ATP-binding protein [Ruminococcus sp.]MCD8345460.1 ABC transporter ATP-binding protein [Oscillospiraceae bacterium]